MGGEILILSMFGSRWGRGGEMGIFNYIYVWFIRGGEEF
jgi:hypothetical protein